MGMLKDFLYELRATERIRFLPFHRVEATIFALGNVMPSQHLLYPSSLKASILSSSQLPALFAEVWS